MKFGIRAAAFAAAFSLSAVANASQPAPALVYHPEADGELDDEQLANVNAFLANLHPLQGEVEIPGAKATLAVSPDHYYLAGDDAKAILVDAWGNPPDDDILGMIFPAGASPLDAHVWGATVYYNDDGYVSDKDAEKIDYDEMLHNMKSAQESDNVMRETNGYDPIEIVGWAESPAYNKETHKLYWARELKFGDDEINTLNYDIRVLGRSGTLVISFISSMEQLGAIRDAAPAVLDMAKFNPGSAYADYVKGVDKKAMYGIAGLIGGAAIAKKTGLIAALLIFGKKFIAIIIAGLAGLVASIKRFFSRSQN